MRIGGIVVGLLALCCISTLGQGTIQAEGIGTGEAVLWFAGTKVTAEFVADFSITGTLNLDGESFGFTANGWARGDGDADTATLALNAWITFSARGTTDAGHDIRVHGGMTPTSVDADVAGGAMGSASGDFLATLFLDGDPIYVRGSAEGAATGGFVPPDDPLTMQVEGQASFNMEGTVVSPSASTSDDAAGEETSDAPDAVSELLPWEPEEWPEHLLDELLSILRTLESQIQTQSETVEAPPAD